MANNNLIGLFDSGVGGLSVLGQIKRLLPNESYVFLADQYHNPYGAKTKRELEQLAFKITKFLIKYHHIKLLVVACNTATCYAIDYLRSNFKIPIVGVVPAIKPAINLSKRGKIAIMSTPATARSKYLKSLINKFAKNTKVLCLGCSNLEESIEYLRLTKISQLLNRYVLKVKNFEADVIVLGCTHYPFFKSDIIKIIGNNVKVIDSGLSIAKRVKVLLQDSKGYSQNRIKDIYYTTGDPEKFSQVASTLLKYKVVAQKAKLS